MDTDFSYRSPFAPYVQGEPHDPRPEVSFGMATQVLLAGHAGDHRSDLAGGVHRDAARLLSEHPALGAAYSGNNCGADAHLASANLTSRAQLRTLTKDQLIATVQRQRAEVERARQLYDSLWSQYRTVADKLALVARAVGL